MLKAEPTIFHRLTDGLRRAFAMESPHGPLTDEDLAMLAKLADKIVKRRMTTPAILFLQSVRPLNMIGSQAMVFLRPFVTPFFNQAQYDRVAAIMERREGIGALVDAIDEAEAASKEPPGE